MYSINLGRVDSGQTVYYPFVIGETVFISGKMGNWKGRGLIFFVNRQRKRVSSVVTKVHIVNTCGGPQEFEDCCLTLQ